MKCANGIFPLDSLSHRAAFTAIFIGLATCANAQCAVDRAELRWDGGNASFTIDLADDFEERQQGLMFVESMPMFQGMLFAYDAPGSVAFWMRNTLIPLDMLFFDETGTLTNLHENAVPLDETSIPGEGQVQFVLEINGGLSNMLGIKGTVELRHPVIDSSKAAWEC